MSPLTLQLMLDDRETPEFQNCSLACIASEAAGNITKEALIDCINECYRWVSRLEITSPKELFYCSFRKVMLDHCHVLSDLSPAQSWSACLESSRVGWVLVSQEPT